MIQWRDWFWAVKQYLVVVDAGYQEELEKLEENLSTEIDWDLLTASDQQRAGSSIAFWEAWCKAG